MRRLTVRGPWRIKSTGCVEFRGYARCQYALTMDGTCPIFAAIKVSRYSVSPKKST
jgi:hypothetical protein